MTEVSSTIFESSDDDSDYGRPGAHGVGSRAAAAEVYIPAHIKHADTAGIINNRELSWAQKEALLFALALGAFVQKFPRVDKSIVGTDAESINDLITFASFLISMRRTQDIEISLEILDEVVAPCADRSPIVEVERIRFLEPHHSNLTDVVMLAAKLWTLERVADPDEVMPTAFLKVRENHPRIIKAELQARRGFHIKRE